MNQLTETLLKSYPAQLVIVAYGSDGSMKDAYLESHQVDEQGRILEGKPLKHETIAAIVDVFFDDRQNQVDFSGMLPANLLLFDRQPGGKYKMIWHRPAERRQLYFASALHLESGEAWVPSLLYSTDGKSLSVFALPGDARPAEATKLYRAPFHNISADGGVCLGSANVKKPPAKTYENMMKYWEDMFWLSEFSHLNGSTNPTKTNINLLWPKLIKDKKLTWDKLKELKEVKGYRLKKLL